MATHDVEVVVIGGSTGALDALIALLPLLPPGFSVPIALVLHLPPTRPSCLPEVLGSRCALTVKEAEDKEPLAAATVYVAPPNYHLLVEPRRGHSLVERRRGHVEPRRCVSLSIDEPVHFSRPAIDVLFESAADACGSAVLGVLLSGASEDGARGLACIEQAGGITLVQAPETASAPLMPEAALRLAPRSHALPAAEIGAWLTRVHRPVDAHQEIE